MVLVVRQLLVKILSSELPALCVGDVVVRVRSKDLRRDSVAVDWDGSGRLKSPSRTRGAPSSGKELRSMSISSRKFPREPGGRYRTMIVRVNGTDTATAWNSKEEMERLGIVITVDTQESCEMPDLMSTPLNLSRLLLFPVIYFLCLAVYRCFLLYLVVSHRPLLPPSDDQRHCLSLFLSFSMIVYVDAPGF